jgi:hypothetical protein
MMTRRRWPLGCGLLLLAVVAAFLLLLKWGPGRRLNPELANPAAMVAEARRLLEHQRLEPKRYEDWLLDEAIPAPLRFPELAYVNVHGDHVDLVILRSPDGPMGLRIWAANATRPHADQPTRYPDIFRFGYTNDLPESPENLP